MSVVLRPLTETDEEQARQAHEELAREDFEFLLNLEPDEPWPSYVERVNRLAEGVGVREGWVPATFLVAEADGQLVGRVSIRHELNQYLMEEGGHVGYAVRPAFRRRGYATAMLRGAVAVARGVGVERLLVTCDADNVASATVIERCGGLLEGIAPARDWSAPKRRYWIEILG